MQIKTVNAALLKRCFLAGAVNLERNKDYINELNVFPVPDGDTGTNMSMTIMTAAAAVNELDASEMKPILKAMASGSLRGARGNSGVIMSQLLRGFCKASEESNKLDAALAAAAFRRGVDTAYKAVMKPKEGTILTVARGMADKIEELAPEAGDLTELLRAVVEHGDEVLKQTPELLPVLKEAGVVDSGGQGLMEFLKGVLAALEGRDEAEGLVYGAVGAGGTHISGSAATGGISGGSAGAAAVSGSAGKTAEPRGKISTDDIKFGYCTEFIVNLDSPLSDEEVASFKEFLESIGDSIVCVADDDMVKVHVHTNHPGQAFEKGLEIGKSLSRMKVDNMREEHEEKLFKDASAMAARAGGTYAEKTDGHTALGSGSAGADGGSLGTGSGSDTCISAGSAAGTENTAGTEDDSQPRPHKDTAFIAVCSGDGLKKIFEGLGADYIIGGGQTMNPSTEDMLKAIDVVNADTVFILPNNKNIILAAEQAARINTDVRIYVIPTKTIPQGITAMINFDETLNPDDNMAAMTESLATVKSGEVTYAVRNTMIDGVEIREGDIMGIGDRGILSVGEVLNDTTLDMVRAMVDDHTSIVTVYTGDGIDDEAAGMLCDSIREIYPDIDVDLERGDQPVYYYIVSAE